VLARMFHINAFCGPSAAGNPGAVCLLEREVSTEWMQMVAAQMNLSESGFVRRLDGDTFSLRWFTPIKEIPICGHVTLAAAHALWQEAQWSSQPTLTFSTASGPLVARQSPDGIEIALPVNICKDVSTPDWLLNALDVKPTRILAGDRKYLVQLGSERDVVHVRPDFGLLRRCADRGVIVTAVSDTPAYDFVSRYFGGYVGVDEDPVTGSAHCCLVPHWSSILGRPLLRARQLSNRGGELRGELVGDLVHLTGRACTVLDGRVCL
jgi:PhzF family phenazine biosynthesis protein